jgi:predicted transcriptional regulator of viral defense system
MSISGLADTHRRALRDLALDQYGYVTPANAEAVGVPAIELRKIAQRGGLDHVGYGLYRFADIPITEFDTFMEAVLRSGPDAHLTHDAVLALHGLALVNPRRIRVGSPHRVRRTLPDSIEVIREQIEPDDLTSYEGIPSTTVRRALLDSRDIVMIDRLVEATEEAGRRGLVPRDRLAALLDEIRPGRS